MNVLGQYSAGALLLILLVFYFVRQVKAYALLCLAVVVGFAVLTLPGLEGAQASEWIVATLGLLLGVFGLLIVRIMLIRSVSLRLLASIDTGRAESMGEDIGGRLGDMRAFKLIQGGDDACQLTGFGRLIGGGVALFYTLFRIAK